MEPFKTGDTVRINMKFRRENPKMNHIEEKYNYNTGKVIDHTENTLKLFVEFKDGNAYFFDAQNLELVSPQPDQTPQPVTPQPDFKDGDRVKIIKSDKGHKGKKGTVVISGYPQLSRFTLVKFKDGSKLQFGNSALKLCPLKPKLLPFNLEKALQGEKVITRDGVTINSVEIEKGREGFPYSVLVSINGGRFYYEKNGRYINLHTENHLDLFMATPKKAKKKTYWMNIYIFNNFPIFSTTRYQSKIDAIAGILDFNNGIGYLKTIKIKL